MKKSILKPESFIFFILLLLLVRLILRDSAGVAIYFLLNLLIITSVIVWILLLYIKYSKMQKRELSGPTFGCAMIAYILLALFFSVLGIIFVLVGLYGYQTYGVAAYGPAILFCILAVIAWFVGLSTNFEVNANGLLLRFHKIFPFPVFPYFYEDLSGIKISRGLVRFDFKEKSIYNKRFFVYKIKPFIEEIQKKKSNLIKSK